ncbi:hypothetical protein F0U60_17315 [Archangium minus]|uniref:Lipoprotein n=1 Tax=Archangium minus TaxID=83450 RepID=A0ABY9WR86_9BACT|nr:hypothetical protein F0U61_17195 [Archangium violaceum]WNG45664.1 hypothetical protein F0U60_17315 [Archangium minus]
MTSVSGPSNARSMSVQSTQPTVSPSKAKAIWQGELDKDVAERNAMKNTEVGWLNSVRVDNYKKNVETDMEKFLQENPDATEDEIREQAKQLIHKHSMHEIIGKMSDDYFLNKIMQKTKELREDMWK